MLRLLPVLIALVVLGGCTTKRVLEVHSEPPGAHVWVNGIHMKERTPVEIPFTHYGRWTLRFEKEGYESVAQDVDIPAGIDGYPVVDLFVETMIPEKRFRRVFTLRPLEPPTDADVATLLERAQAFRTRSNEEAQGATAPKRLLPGSNDLLP